MAVVRRVPSDLTLHSHSPRTAPPTRCSLPAEVKVGASIACSVCRRPRRRDAFTPPRSAASPPEKTYGRAAAANIYKRGSQLVGQVFGGNPAPPLATLQGNGLAAVDADIFCEQLVEECRRNGIYKVSDPNWRSKVNARLSALTKRRIAELEKRGAVKPKPAAPQPNIEQLVSTAVERALDARAAKVPSGEVPPSRYLGIWEEGRSYRWADEVTFDGSRWWAKWDTDRKPGDGEQNGWQLTHKSFRTRHNRNAGLGNRNAGMGGEGA